MTRTIAEIEQEIQMFEAALQNPQITNDPQSLSIVTAGLDALRQELAQAQAQGATATPPTQPTAGTTTTTPTAQPTSAPTSTPAAAPPPAPQQPAAPVPPSAASSNVMAQIVNILTAMMQTGSGSGVDSAEVRALIQQYLQTDKVKLGELDQSVLDEIRKNQIVEIMLPNYSKKLTVPKQTADLPNFFEIIDDLLAGNNIFLIGEAGAGKTYTAETVCKVLSREYMTINCSQYTSPMEILGGQTIEGYKTGKLIKCWQTGKVLILDEMPKLDANTAGLFNDALAKSTHTKSASSSKIYSANPEEPPFERNNNFGCIATGNLYPNRRPDEQYGGNNRQDLSLLDRFSGSVYFTEFDKNTDQNICRYSFLYDLFVGNYYEWVANRNLTTSGLRTVITARGYTNLALVSYRTLTGMRVAFELELVREIARREGKTVIPKGEGKTLVKAFASWMVAFRANPAAATDIITTTNMTDVRLQQIVDDTIDSILDPANPQGFKNSLTKYVQDSASDYFDRYKDFFVADTNIVSADAAIVSGQTSANP